MDYTTDELRKHFGNKPILGQIRTVVKHQGAIANGFTETSSRKLDYPDRRPVDDIWVPLDGTLVLKKSDWILIEMFESGEGAVGGQTHRLKATKFVPLIETRVEQRPRTDTSGLYIVGNRVLATPDLAQMLDAPEGSGVFSLLVPRMLSLDGRTSKTQHEPAKTESAKLKRQREQLDARQKDQDAREKRLEEGETRLNDRRQKLDEDETSYKIEHQQLDKNRAAFQEVLKSQGFEIAEDGVRPSADFVQIWLNRPEVLEKLRGERIPEIDALEATISERKAEVAALEEKKSELHAEVDGLEKSRHELLQEAGHLKQLKREVEELFEIATPLRRVRLTRSRQVPVSTFADERELLANVKQYIRASGFYYDDGLVENFYTCLKADYLVILSGISGVGKSRLPALFAEALDGVFESIPVRPDWNDDRDLLGFFDFQRQAYQSTRFLDLLLDANHNPDRLYIVCFDEMNLAPVEYYFAQFLSELERPSPRRLAPPDEALTSDAIEQFQERALIEMERLQASLNSKSGVEHHAVTLEIQGWSRLQSDLERYQSVPIPSNVKFVGTVNVDHTTHGFSDKVLDRANVIQFERANLGATIKPGNPSRKGLDYSVFEQYSELRQLTKNQTGKLDDYLSQVRKINQILDPAGLSIGFRVLKQIQSYMHMAIQGEYFENPDIAFDFQIKQRILPKVRGMQSAELGTALKGLRDLLQTIPYAKSLEKVAGRKRDGSNEPFGGMLQQLDIKGYVNYWETR